jgi:hypothetical protein
MGSHQKKRAPSVVQTLFWLIGLTIFTISTQASPTPSVTTKKLPATTKKINIMTTSENGNKLSFLNDLRAKYQHQPTFLQSVEEIALSLLPLFEDPEKGDFYKRAFVAMTEPERAITFRVPWMDDNGSIHFNRGYRVEFSRLVSRMEFLIGISCFILYSSGSYRASFFILQRPGTLQGRFEIPSERRRRHPQIPGI